LLLASKKAPGQLKKVILGIYGDMAVVKTPENYVLKKIFNEIRSCLLGMKKK